MTIAKTGNRAQYSGDGTTVAFVFPYRFFAAGDLGVYVLASGVETKQTLTTNYTVSNTDTEDGGTVTFLVAPANGAVVTIIGETPLTQAADYTANDAFPALTHETALDRTVRLVQQQAEILGRAVVAPVSDTASLELPFDRANKFLAFDASKNPIATAGVSSVPVSDFMEDVLQSADAAAFFTALESAALEALAPLVPAADRLPYFNAVDGAALATLTAAGRAILDDADAAAQRTTLGLVIGTNVQAYDAALQSLAGLSLAQGDILYATAADTLARLPKGMSAQVLRMNAGATAPEWAAAGEWLFTSSDQTITPNSILTIPHGLGRAPIDAQVLLKCTTADAGYSVGDILYLGGTLDDGGAGYQIIIDNGDTTNVKVLQGAARAINNKSTFVRVALTAASWRLVVRAR